MNNLIIKSFGAFINITAFLFPKWNKNNSFKLLSKVQRASISEKGKAFLDIAEQHYFEVDGHSSVLHKWGNGPNKVLFLHGWLSDSQRWLPYHERLDLNKHTMYALDAPGHGMSRTNFLNIELYRQAINEALKAIGPIDTLVCHSFSNTAITYTYLVNPDIDVKRFILMGAPSGMDAIFNYFLEMINLSKSAIKILDGKINEILKIPHSEILIQNFLDKAPQPKLVIHDVNDSITPFAPIKAAIENNASLETLITTGLKHDLKGDEVYDRVHAFINE